MSASEKNLSVHNSTLDSLMTVNNLRYDLRADLECTTFAYNCCVQLAQVMSATLIVLSR